MASIKHVFRVAARVRIITSGADLPRRNTDRHQWNRFLRLEVGESATQSLVDRMHRCAMVLDDTARLFCYDSLGSRQPAKGGERACISLGH
jgi:hypothetical protein